MAAQKNKREKLVETAGLNIGFDDDDDEIIEKPKNQTADIKTERNAKTLSNRSSDNLANNLIDNSTEQSTEKADKLPDDSPDNSDDSPDDLPNKLTDKLSDKLTDKFDSDHSLTSASYQVVARRYRPKTFAELVGQTHISQALANAISTGRIGHAYLFTGARGVGKTSTARIFSKSLNCVTGPTSKPCGVCDSCIGISTGEDIDVLEIDGASNRGIDEIRQLRLSASICPSRSKYKIYIIDEVHMLTREAFNALLKILEEPPEHVKFIFCTTEPSKIPITILSRCQRYDFAGIDIKNISQHLSEIAANEGITAEEGVFELLARRAAGSMRDAQSLLEQLLSFAPQRINLEDVHNMLGTANDQLLFQLLDSISACDTAKIFVDIDKAISEGVDLTVLIEQMIGFFRDLLVVVSGGKAQLMIFCTPNQFEKVSKLANTFGIQRLLAAIQILDQTYSRMRYNTQTRVLVELALVRIAYLDNFQMISVLLDKLRKGEIQINLPVENNAVLSGETVKSARRVVQSASGLRGQANVGVKISDPTRQVITEIKSTEKTASPKLKNETTKSESQTDLSTTGLETVSPKVWSLVELNKIDSDKATEIWRNATDSVAGILGSSAAIFLRVQFVKPETFVVVFQNLSTKEYCERELPRLRAALCQTVGRNVQLRLVHEEIKQAAKSSPVQSRTSQESRAIFESAANNPLVKKIADLFRTEIIDAK